MDTGRPTEFALTSVYGYGRVRAKRLQAEVGLHGHYPLSRMRESQREYIRRTVNDSCVAYDEPERAAGAAGLRVGVAGVLLLRRRQCFAAARRPC